MPRGTDCTSPPAHDCNASGKRKGVGMTATLCDASSSFLQNPAGATPDVSVQLQAALDEACQAARMPPQMQQPY